MSQIALPLSFDRQFSFENYFSANPNLVIASLKALIDSESEPLIGLWGGRDSGKTHLLNACVHYAREQSVDMQLYDGWQLLEFPSDQISDFDGGGILAVDNLDGICGQLGWEKKFYQIINRCRDQGARLIFTLSDKPQDTVCQLADFQSRLTWGLLLELPRYSDAEVHKIIEMRAQLLGIRLSKEVVSYLLTHFSRQLSDQMKLLRLLDNASLRTQKKITIPLLKQVLESSILSSGL